MPQFVHGYRTTDVIHLTQEQKEHILNETDAIIAETLATCEAFGRRGRKVDLSEWKFVKTQEKLDLFRQRTTKKKQQYKFNQERMRQEANAARNDQVLAQPVLLPIPNGNAKTRSQDEEDRRAASSSVSTTNSSKTDNSITSDELKRWVDDSDDDSGGDGSSNNSNRSTSVSGGRPSGSLFDLHCPPHRPLVIVSGFLDGTINDAAFGVLADNDVRWRVRNTYTYQNYGKTKLLATLQAPRQEDPFRFVGVKWSLQKASPLSMMADRDLLYVESTGIALDSKGQRIYYMLTHSMPMLEALLPSDLKKRHSEVVRATASFCYIVRNVSATTVGVFAKGFADHGGDMFDHVSSLKFMELLFAANYFVECSYAKKLTWNLHLATMERANAPRDSVSSSLSSRCHACEKSVNKFANLVQTGSLCQICRLVRG
ncbi:hypothetical protein FI667_g7042, partial [Globisporangium splendens]